MKNRQQTRLSLEECLQILSEDFACYRNPITGFAPLGEGAFSYVYSACYDRSKDIAFKLLKTEFSVEDESNSRFKEECAFQKYASSEIEGIVKSYDHGEFKGHCFMTMELMHSEHLGDMASRYRSYPVKSRISIIVEVAQILSNLHSFGPFVHRDIKPENILFTRDTEPGSLTDPEKAKGHVKLSDFGLIRCLHEPYGEEHIVGSPDYMAPEQIQRPWAVDQRTDVFGFGAVAYQLFNGEPPREVPFKLQYDDGYFSELAKTRPSPIRNINDTVNRELNAILMKCMEHNPKDRYQSMRDVHQDLVRYYGNIERLSKTITYLNIR